MVSGGAPRRAGGRRQESSTSDGGIQDRRSTPKRIAVVGSGYVGSVVAACFAHIGHRVVGVESDPKKLRQLESGQAPFYEPGLDALIERSLAAGNLSFSGALADAVATCDVLFLCVGTPSAADGQPDLSALREAARVIADNLRAGQVIVTKSTVPIGTGRWLSSIITDRLSSRAAEAVPFGIVSNPEFLREGHAVQDFLHPDRVVLGSNNDLARQAVAEVYRPILEQRIPGYVGGRASVPLVDTGLATAEMIKYASNGFLATKISYANEIARLCEYVGADVTEVTAGMGLDRRVGPAFLDAGMGWGGSCLGKDLQALLTTASEYGYRPRLLEASISVNDGQRQLVIERLLTSLQSLRGARICVLGLAFKPYTDDTRDSPGLDVCRRLLARDSFVSAFDPMVKSTEDLPDLRIASDPYDAARGADALLLATDWPEFLDLDLRRLRQVMDGDWIFDGRNMLDPETVHLAGFRYLGFGRHPISDRQPRIRLLPEPTVIGAGADNSAADDGISATPDLAVTPATTD